MKRTVAIGFIGATLDRLGKGAARWQKWRPSIGLCQQPDLLIDRLELIHGNDARDLGLAERIRADIAAVSPHTEVRLQQMELRNPWDFEEVYGALHDFVSAYPSTPSARTTWCISPPGPMSRRSAGSSLPRRATCRPAGADLAVAAQGRGAPSRGLGDADRPRPVPLRPHRLAVPPRTGGKPGFSQVGNRHAQCRFQPLHRADRAGRRAFAGTHAAGGADRCRQIVPRPAHL